MAIKEYYTDPQIREHIENDVSERKSILASNAALLEKHRREAGSARWQQYSRDYPIVFDDKHQLYKELSQLGVIDLLEEFTGDKVSVITHEGKGYFIVERPLFDGFSIHTPDEEFEKLVEKVNEMKEKNTLVWNMVVEGPILSRDGEWNEGLEIKLEETEVTGWPYRHTTGRFVTIFYIKAADVRMLLVKGEGRGYILEEFKIGDGQFNENEFSKAVAEALLDPQIETRS